MRDLKHNRANITYSIYSIRNNGSRHFIKGGIASRKVKSEMEKLKKANPGKEFVARDE